MIEKNKRYIAPCIKVIKAVNASSFLQSSIHADPTGEKATDQQYSKERGDGENFYVGWDNWSDGETE